MRKIDWELAIPIIILVMCAIAIIVSIVLTIVAFVNYGNLPIDEIPAWALKFMDIFGRNK